MPSNNSLHNISFIESQFPVSKVSKESYKERKANYSQTLTGLGKLVGTKTIDPCQSSYFGFAPPSRQ